MTLYTDVLLQSHVVYFTVRDLNRDHTIDIHSRGCTIDPPGDIGVTDMCKSYSLFATGEHVLRSAQVERCPGLLSHS